MHKVGIIGSNNKIGNKTSLHVTVSALYCRQICLTLSTRAEFSNSVDLDEVAHNEPPHLDLHCLPSSPLILNMI